MAQQASGIVSDLIYGGRDGPWAAVVAGKMRGAAGKLVLNVGSGPENPEKLPAFFRGVAWCEIRVDIEPAVRPDVLGSITDLGEIPDAAVDAVYSSHNLEHIFAHEVPGALSEFRRVLKPGGMLAVTMPDLQAVCEVVARGDMDRVIYGSVDGRTPIRALDIIYGWGAMIARGQHYMAHRTGFTETTLVRHLRDAGFVDVTSMKGQTMDLWARAIKPA